MKHTRNSILIFCALFCALFCAVTAYRLAGENVVIERRLAELEWQLRELQAIAECK